MTITASKNEIVQELRDTPNGDGFWVERAVALAELLHDNGISVESASLLNDMIEASQTNERVKQYLINLPGVGAEDWVVADQHLGYCSMQIRSALSRIAAKLDRTTAETRKH